MTGWKTWAALEEVTAANMNSYVRDQVVQVFTNSATRSAAITAPTKGLVSYLTDSGSLETYYGATTGWRKPWSEPWGVIGKATITATTAAATQTTVSGSTLTVATATNRVLRWTMSAHYLFASVNDVGRFSIQSGTTGGSRLSAVDFLPFSSSTTIAVGVGLVWYETTAATGNLSRRLTVERVSGTGGNITFFCDSTRPAVFLCEDMGPASDPPTA